MLNTIANFTKEKGYTYLKGEYIETAKNEMVKNHYFHLGFQQSGNYWILNAGSYTNKKSFIKIK